MHVTDESPRACKVTMILALITQQKTHDKSHGKIDTTCYDDKEVSPAAKRRRIVVEATRIF